MERAQRDEAPGRTGLRRRLQRAVAAGHRPDVPLVGDDLPGRARAVQGHASGPGNLVRPAGVGHQLVGVGLALELPAHDALGPGRLARVPTCELRPRIRRRPGPAHRGRDRRRVIPGGYRALDVPRHLDNGAPAAQVVLEAGRARRRSLDQERHFHREVGRAGRVRAAAAAGSVRQVVDGPGALVRGAGIVLRRPLQGDRHRPVVGLPAPGHVAVAVSADHAGEAQRVVRRTQRTGRAPGRHAEGDEHDQRQGRSRLPHVAVLGSAIRPPPALDFSAGSCGCAASMSSSFGPLHGHWPLGCPRQESNLRTRFRKPLLYPLSYGGGGN